MAPGLIGLSGGSGGMGLTMAPGSDLKQYDKATSDYTEAIRLQPDFAQAFNDRGIAYKALQQYDKAVSDYTEDTVPRRSSCPTTPRLKGGGRYLRESVSSLLRESCLPVGPVLGQRDARFPSTSIVPR